MKTKPGMLERGGRALSVLNTVMGMFGNFGQQRLPVSSEEAERRRKMRERNAPKNNERGTGGYLSRQQSRRQRFMGEFGAIRQQHGAGNRTFSYAEGMTRKAARKITRNRLKLVAKKAAA